MSISEQTLKECNEVSQQLNAEKQKNYERIQKLLAKRLELRRVHVQKEDAINVMYTEATVDGLTEYVREADCGCGAHRNVEATTKAGNLIVKVTQLYENDVHVPLIDVPACLEQAMKESNFRGKEFDFTGNRCITDAFLRTIAPLLIHAERLKLNNTPVRDLTPLAGWKGLEELDLSGTNVVELKFLAGLSGLRELSLANTRVVDLTPLVKLTQLQVLYLYGTRVTDLTPLSGLIQLQKLFLRGTKVKDLTPLAELSGLQFLNLKGTTVPRDDAVVRGLEERGVKVLR